MELDASLIIATRNRAGILSRSLKRFLARSSRDCYEVLVVSDGADDDTASVVRAFKNPGLRFFQKEKGGPGRARNLGMKEARGRIEVFADDDCLVRGDFIRRHVLAHQGRGKIIATGPIVTVRRVLDKLPGTWRGYHRNPFPTTNVSIEKKLAREAKGFCEDFTLYGWEDMELGLRLKKMGAKRRWVRKAPVFHYKPVSQVRDLKYRLNLEIQRGSMGALFHRRHPGPGVALLTKRGKAFDLMDTFLDRTLGLDKKMARILENGHPAEPTAALWRKLLLLHAEVKGGREETWARALFE